MNRHRANLDHHGAGKFVVVYEPFAQGGAVICVESETGAALIDQDDFEAFFDAVRQAEECWAKDKLEL